MATPETQASPALDAPPPRTNMNMNSDCTRLSTSITFWTATVNPPVQLVDMSHLQKGVGLVASRSIQQGQVVFTERVPTESTIAMPTSRDATTHSSIKHCHHCFSSMEPASSYFYTGGSGSGSGSHSCLPLSHLWPNPEYGQQFEAALRGNYKYNNAMAMDQEQEQEQEEDNTVRNMDDTCTCTCTCTSTCANTATEEVGKVPGLEEENCQKDTTRTTATNVITDEHDRVLCTVCKALFCSMECHQSFLKEILPNCCQYQELAEAILDVALQYNDPLDADACLYNHWEVVLACRIFCSRLTYLRQTTHTANTNNNNHPSCTMLAQAMEGMCGDAQDLARLQVGVLFHGQQPRTVEPFYQAICNTLGMTCQEKQILSLAVLERLAIVCSRNSLHVASASPWTIYQDRVNQQIATQSVDTAEAILRDMKRAMVQLVTKSHMAMQPMECGTVPCCAVLPLFSRLNHSCESNLQVMDRTMGHAEESKGPGSASLSSHRRLAVDLIATRDIAKGEELTICYFSPTAATLGEKQRNTRLQSRYLFTCHCSRCMREREPATTTS
jgi:SET domain